MHVIWLTAIGLLGKAAGSTYFRRGGPPLNPLGLPRGVPDGFPVGLAPGFPLLLVAERSAPCPPGAFDLPLRRPSGRSKRCEGSLASKFGRFGLADCVASPWVFACLAALSETPFSTALGAAVLGPASFRFALGSWFFLVRGLGVPSGFCFGFFAVTTPSGRVLSGFGRGSILSVSSLFLERAAVGRGFLAAPLPYIHIQIPRDAGPQISYAG